MRSITTTTLALLASAALPAGAAAAVTFAPAASYPAGSFPRAVDVADVNRDGRADVVTANSFGNDVSVLLSDAAGGLQAAVRYPVGTDPRAVVVADLNRDGHPDVATANAGSGDVTVLRGSRTGALTHWVTVAADEGARGIVAGDLDGDRKPDLATANAGGLTDSVAVLLRRGTGFERTSLITNGEAGDNPVGITAAHLNLDSRLDLVTANNVGYVLPQLGTGGGAFAKGVRAPTGHTPEEVVAGDWDSDGDADLATANINGASVSVLLGRGDGEFDAAAPVNLNRQPAAIATADLDRDGHPDLATANITLDDVSVLAGRGGGAFQNVLNPRVGRNPSAVATGDVDGDGRADVVTVSLIDGTASVLRNTTDVTAPTIAIKTPKKGATYRRGQQVPADYSCTDEPGGTGVASCEGTVPVGAPIDTLASGKHSFTVVATDANGNQRSLTVTYRVGNPGKPAPRSPLQQLLDQLGRR